MKLERFRILTFAIAGVIAFAVDVFLMLLLNPYIGFYFSRIVSFFFAVYCSWFINRNYSFSDIKLSISKFQEFLDFFVLMLVGGALNFGVYALLIFYFDYFKHHPDYGVAIGSLIGMLVNYTNSRLFLYKSRGE